MSIQTVLLYLIAWSLVALTPGPAVMCVMSQAVKFGLRAALTGIFGIQMGNLSFPIFTMARARLWSCARRLRH
jgi:threonine/homoserine/homoserine lactone efflux protein